MHIFLSGVGQAPLWAGVAHALSSSRCYRGCNRGSSSLGWGAPHPSDWTHSRGPCPGSLHFPARLGPGFVPVGEARRAQACGPPRLVWPPILQSWLRGRLPRGSPHPARGGRTLFSSPVPPFFSLKSSSISTTRSHLSISASRPASTYISLAVNQILKTKTFDKLSVLEIALISHGCYSLSVP